MDRDDSTAGSFVLAVFLLFLGGVMLRLCLRRLPLPQWTVREAVLFSGALNAAAYLAAASLYGLLLLPLVCVAQGMALGFAAEAFVRAAASGEGLSWRLPLFFLLQLPVLFLLMQRGFANAAILAEQRLRLRGAAPGKEFLLLTGLLLVSAFATIFAYC